MNNITELHELIYVGAKLVHAKIQKVKIRMGS